MSRRNLLIVVSLAVVAGAVGFTRFAFDDESDPARAAAPLAAKLPEPAVAAATAPAGKAALATVPAGPPDHAAEFKAADDLLVFSRRMHAAAEAGDAAAMYHIYAVGQRCGSEHSLAFESDDGKGDLPLEEALAREAKRPVNGGVEIVRRLYTQCVRWKASPTEDWRARDAWLEKSANAGYPPGQADWAGRLMSRRGNHEDPTPEERARARELTLAALRSRDPNAFHEAQYVVQSFIQGDEYDEVAAAAWFYAACLRGVDCGPQSEIVRMHCARDPACQPYEDLIDILRRGRRANEAGEIERRAREISDFIDAGRWSDLGIGE